MNHEIIKQEKNENISPNYFVVIPSHILDDPEIDDSTAILFGRIASLSSNKGYCYASDKYLAELTRCCTREVKRRIKKLEDRGYVRKETKKNGVLWDRKIYPNFNYEGNIRSLRKDHTVPSKGLSGPHNNISNNNKESIPKGIPKKKPEPDGSSRPKPSASDSPPTLKKSLKKPKEKPSCTRIAPKNKTITIPATTKERAKHVKTSDEEHEKIIKKFGIERTNKCYEKLSLWKEDTPKSKWKKSDYRSILRWVIDAVVEDEQKEKKRAAAQNAETNEEHGKKIVENFMVVRCKEKGVVLELCPEGVLFRYKNSTSSKMAIVKFSEKGFKTLLDHELRKWGLL